MTRGAYVRTLTFFLAPALLIYSMFSIYPLLNTVLNSFYDKQDNGSFVFNGIANYATLLADPTWSAPFWNAFWNNCKFFAIHMLVKIPLDCCLPPC